ncbi:hypothetical protein HDU89_002014 [Geranomyces variabilis]|nr:hypothetical protein HDU89_002014 [Geranomyces variabilis]
MIDQNGVHLYVPAPLLVEEQAIVSQAAQLSAAKAELAAVNADHAAALDERDAALDAAIAERDAAIAQLELAKQKINRLEFVAMTQRAELALLRPLAVKALHAKALTTDFFPLNRPRSSRTRTRTTPVAYAHIKRADAEQMGTLRPGLTFGKDDTTWLDG